MQTDDLHFSVECNINGELKQVKGLWQRLT